MKKEENKIYLLQAEYSIVEIKNKKKKVVDHQQKKYIFRDLDSLDDKLKNFENVLWENQEPTSLSWFDKMYRYFKNYGSYCKTTYESVLRL